jgi:hypothetical protein
LAVSQLNPNPAVRSSEPALATCGWNQLSAGPRASSRYSPRSTTTPPWSLVNPPGIQVVEVPTWMDSLSVQWMSVAPEADSTRTCTRA